MNASSPTTYIKILLGTLAGFKPDDPSVIPEVLGFGKSLAIMPVGAEFGGNPMLVHAAFQETVERLEIHTGDHAPKVATLLAEIEARMTTCHTAWVDGVFDTWMVDLESIDPHRRDLEGEHVRFNAIMASVVEALDKEPATVASKSPQEREALILAIAAKRSRLGMSDDQHENAALAIDKIGKVNVTVAASATDGAHRGNGHDEERTGARA